MSISRDQIQSTVLRSLEAANMSREADSQLPIGPEAPIFGPGSPLDSLGLVSLLIDIEEGLRDHGLDVSLSSDRAMSQKHSPFRNVPSLVQFIEQMLVAAKP